MDFKNLKALCTCGSHGIYLKKQMYTAYSVYIYIIHLDCYRRNSRPTCVRIPIEKSCGLACEV